MSARVRVAGIGDLQDGSMKEVPFPDSDSQTKILLSKVSGKYYATSNKCTHYGAPLVKGVITASGRVVCPWHGACFNACTGDIEDAPGLNNLQKFVVETEGDSVFVLANPADVANSRPPASVSIEVESTKDNGVLIVGGGAGAAHAIEGLREAGYAGKIKVLSKEMHLPIDRTKLSKALITDAGKIALRNDDFYKTLGAEFVFDTEVTSVDFASNTVLAGSTKFPYSHLILSPGATPNRIPVDGSKLDNIFVLRTVEDAKAIDAALGHDENVKKNVVIVGSSFIGMETALACSKRGKVSVVGMENTPFELILGKEVGEGIRKHHEAQGTKFYLPASLSHFEPSSTSPNAVGSVVLKDGPTLPADLVVMGVGVRPATSFLKESGIDVEKDGGVVVDQNLRLKGVKQGNVFAIGDIAKFPDHVTGQITRVEHWNVASNHGRSVAKTIAGKSDVYSKVAVFWSAQGQQLRYAGTGRAKEWKDVHIVGDASALKFVAYYYGKSFDNEIVAVASMQNDPVAAHVSELFALGKMLSAADIKAGKSPFDIPLSQ
ncbi:FAD/NAD(P)-binding domain-containing protein [Meredithblackwellia eburnea MCA 4105]